MAKNLCGPAVMEAVQAPGLPRYLISRLQLVLAPPEEQRSELLPAAIALELEPQTPAVAADSNPQVVPQVFLEPALESFPALALLFFRLISPSQLFCLPIRFSFAMFSSPPSVLASGWETFSISLEQQLISGVSVGFGLGVPSSSSPDSFSLLLCEDSFCVADVSVLSLDSFVASVALGMGLGDFPGVGDALRFFVDLLSPALVLATGFGDFFGVGDEEVCVSCWPFPDSSPDFSSSLLTCPRRRLPAIAPRANAVASQRRKRTTATERNRTRDPINGIAEKS